jgi:hypothetical protein
MDLGGNRRRRRGDHHHRRGLTRDLDVSKRAGPSARPARFVRPPIMIRGKALYIKSASASRTERRLPGGWTGGILPPTVRRLASGGRMPPSQRAGCPRSGSLPTQCATLSGSTCRVWPNLRRKQTGRDQRGADPTELAHAQVAPLDRPLSPGEGLEFGRYLLLTSGDTEGVIDGSRGCEPSTDPTCSQDSHPRRACPNRHTPEGVSE